MELIIRTQGREEAVHIERRGSGYLIVVGETTYEVDPASAGGEAKSLLIDGRQHELGVHDLGEGRYRVSTEQGESTLEVLDPLVYQALQAQGGDDAGGAHRVCAYMPGRVVKILAAEGDTVESGQGLVILEAMKMENEIQAESTGVVKKIWVEEGQAVDGDDPLFDLE